MCIITLSWGSEQTFLSGTIEMCQLSSTNYKSNTFPSMKFVLSSQNRPGCIGWSNNIITLVTKRLSRSLSLLVCVTLSLSSQHCMSGHGCTPGLSSSLSSISSSLFYYQTRYSHIKYMWKCIIGTLPHLSIQTFLSATSVFCLLHEQCQSLSTCPISIAPNRTFLLLTTKTLCQTIAYYVE